MKPLATIPLARGDRLLGLQTRGRSLPTV